MPTLRQLIEEDNARAAFAPEWLEEITHHHFLASGIEDVPATVGCFVFREREEGSNENQIDGSGRELDNLQGHRIRSSYSVLLPNDLEIDKSDYFEIDEMRWYYVRHLDRDSCPAGSKRILVVNNETEFTRAPRLRGVGARSHHGAMG